MPDGQRRFVDYHRAASEELLGAVRGPDKERLDSAKEYGELAFAAAINEKERVLAIGLLETVEKVRSVS